jgi:hypothetical protein
MTYHDHAELDVKIEHLSRKRVISIQQDDTILNLLDNSKLIVCKLCKRRRLNYQLLLSL